MTPVVLFEPLIKNLRFAHSQIGGLWLDQLRTVRASLSVLGFMLLGGLRLPAQAPEAPVITTSAEFWNVPVAEKQKPHRVKMEITVYYYDPIWNLLWGESDGKGTYLPTRNRALPVHSGQRVRLEGTVVPAEGFDADRITCAILGENAWPKPIPVAGHVGDFGRLDTQWVEVEGYVFGQSDPDSSHVLYELMSENQLLSLRLQISGADPVPQLTGAHIRVRAVYIATRDSAGGLQQIECWTAQRSDIEVLGWLADDERFKLPRIRIDQIASAAGQKWVHLSGTVKAQESGSLLTLRDESGQVVIPTVQPEVLPGNALVEVVGKPVEEAIGWTLREPLYREATAAVPASRSPRGGSPALSQLRQAKQVLELPPDEAEKRYPVTLRGVVTWFDERAPFFYLQDVSGGVCIRRRPGSGGTFSPGTSLAVTGVTLRGSYVPEVELIEAAYVSMMALPPARAITLEQALSGAEEAGRVEMHGYVRQIATEGDWQHLELTGAAGEFSAVMPARGAVDYLQGAMVRVRGICSVQTDSNREISGVRLWLQNSDAVSVDEPKPADPFSGPVESISALRQFAGLRAINHRLHLTGMLLLQQPGRYLYLQDQSGGIFVLTRETKLLRPGTWIDAAGILGGNGSRLVLREAEFRAAPERPPLAPRLLEDSNLVDSSVDAQLVRVQAVVRQIVKQGPQLRLTLEAGGKIFEATLPAGAGWEMPGAGSLLELTGVYVIEFDEYRNPRGFRLELRAPDDVHLLSLPPWWTERRTWSVLGGLVVVTLAIFLWVIALRRRVREQTEQIRFQLEKEASMHEELERSSRLDSLGLLAGGIAHDFNNMLTAILGNLGLIGHCDEAMALVGPQVQDALKATRRAGEVTQQLLTFAKGGDPVRTAVDLPEMVREAAGFALHGSSVRLEYEISENLPFADVDAAQINRVVHNLVLNAVQAMPHGGVVTIRLGCFLLTDGGVPALPAGHYLRLTVADNGPGIPPERLARIFDPYFSTKAKGSGLGLATAYSIVKKHQAHIAVESKVGAGTTFSVWLPAAIQPVTKAVHRDTQPPVTTSARVLIMDDEEIVRGLAQKILTKVGHEATTAADGSETVDLYQQALGRGRPFDLVILDLTVPGGMGGVDTLAALRKIDPQVKAIASSGYSTDAVMANFRAHGFQAVVPKPYDIETIVRAIDRVRRN